MSWLLGAYSLWYDAMLSLNAKLNLPDFIDSPGKALLFGSREWGMDLGRGKGRREEG